MWGEAPVAVIDNFVHPKLLSGTTDFNNLFLVVFACNLIAYSYCSSFWVVKTNVVGFVMRIRIKKWSFQNIIRNIFPIAPLSIRFDNQKNCTIDPMLMYKCLTMWSFSGFLTNETQWTVIETYTDMWCSSPYYPISFKNI